MVRSIRNIIFLFFILSFSLLYAQREENAEHVKLFFYISAQSQIKNLRYGILDDTGAIIDSILLKFKTSGRSSRYKYEGPNRLIIFTEEPSPTPENPTAVRRTPMATVQITPGTKEALILFSPILNAQSSAPRYSTVFVSLDEQQFPNGHLTIYNTTNLNYKGVLQASSGESKPIIFDVNPGLNSPQKLHPAKALILAFNTQHEEWVTTLEKKFQIDPYEKVFFIVYPPVFSGSTRLTAKTISFLTSPLEDEKE